MLITLVPLRFVCVGFLLLISLPASRATPTPPPPRYVSLPTKPVSTSVDDRIIGRWYFPVRESDIEIYRENGRYFARIVAVSQATADKFGAMANKMLLTDLKFAKNEWAGGQLIHPQTGNRFDVFLKLTDANTLVITAYKGCRLFNKAYTLTRL